MTQIPAVSLVIVSRHRPKDLAKVLAALRFQSVSSLEIIVVAPDLDTQGLKSDFADVLFIDFDQPNISQARNIGIFHARADIIAFCDDDSIPEIHWLDRLLPAFRDKSVASAGGPVRGRNGINLQWSARLVNSNAQEIPVNVPTDQPYSVFPYNPDGFLKLQGTNIAFRADPLRAIGGFDENYHFYLDETDVLLRLGQAGWHSAFVPLAEVQHGFQKSIRRTPKRAPKSLYQEGRSAAYFLKRHSNDILSSLNEMRDAQRKRIFGFLQNGNIGPWDVKRLLHSLENGVQDGFQLNASETTFSHQTPNYEAQVVKTNYKYPVALFGNALQWRKVKNLALKYAEKGHPVTVFRMTYTALFHRRYFSRWGFWVQAGGWFGRSHRTGPSLCLQSRYKRMIYEKHDHSKQRPFAKIIYVTLLGKIKEIEN